MATPRGLWNDRSCHDDWTPGLVLKRNGPTFRQISCCSPVASYVSQLQNRRETTIHATRSHSKSVNPVRPQILAIIDNTMPPVTRPTTRLSKIFQTQVEATTAPERAPSFPQFNRRPLEVRMLIWEAAIEPRIVHLQIRPLRECHHILRQVRSDVAVPDLCGPLAPLNVRLYTWRDLPAFDELDEYIESQRNRSW
jgi:hypothetical protein